MSGDVQPRKRKDKKRKKDDLGVSEPRGTSAALGDGDVFMHSQHEHGTGGHWCAKIVFFSLLAILVGLVGLIILENRGLSELEANAVQSQYSGVLEGWLEDAPEDDHHDEHTLELNHHDDEDDADHGDEAEHSEEADDEHDDDDDDDDDDDENDHDELQDDESDEEEPQNDEEDDEDVSQEQDVEAHDEDEDLPYRKYYHDNQADLNDDDNDDNDQNDQGNDDDDDDGGDNDDDDDDDDDQIEQDDNYQNYQDDDDQNDQEDGDDNDEDSEIYQDNEDNDEDVKSNDSLENDYSHENNDVDEENDANEYDTRENEVVSQEHNNKDDEEHEEEEEDTSLEVEKIEHEASDEEPISTELPALPEPDDDDDDKDDSKAQESAEDGADSDDEEDDADDNDGLLQADDDEPPVERITAPAGKPFAEVEEETSSEKPTDTLDDEEEYEKRQEELRREEAQASHMWLKLTVGGALLVATHAIIRRATASSDASQSEESAREETPAVDRRMTLIPEEPSQSVPIRKVTQESTRPLVQDVTKQIPSIVKSSPTFEESEEEVEEEEEKEEPVVSKVIHAAQSKQQEMQELYSDEEEADDEDIEEEEEEVVVKKQAPQAAKQPTPEPEPDGDVPDDVEIIDDEQIEEEAEEDEDEEEISDVDDEELLTRLEAKYGRLSEPERPPRHKDGGNSVEDEWPGEPSDAYWRQQLDQAEREFHQGAWLAAADRASAKQLQSSARGRFLVAKSLDALAENKRDNALLGRAIAAYLELLKMNERLSDKKLLEVTERTINRIQFRGNYLNAEPVYRLLIRRFPDDPSHRNNLTVIFLMANRADLAEEVLKETLKRWPDDRLALAQYGFVLKTQHNRLEEAAVYLQKALKGDTGPAAEPRYYYHLGDTLLLLGRFKEAEEVHKRGAAHGHFLSPAQRSLYNVPRLRARPWWKIEDTPYVKLARSLEGSWRAILREGEAAKALYEEEKEGLRERGEWGQLDLFVRGREVAGRCARAPAACAAVRAEPAAAGCRRGQVKFSAMRPGTHVRPHVGPTNCRLRMHLALTNTKDTFLRVDQETRQWKAGEVFIFDDSFEHEVWHNGTGERLVLIVDVWHPDLTPAERRQLPAI